MKIKNKIILSFTSLFLLIYTIIGALTYINISKSFSKLIDNDVEKNLNTKSEAIAFYFESLTNEMISLAQSPILTSNDNSQILVFLKKKTEEKNGRIEKLFYSNIEGESYSYDGKNGNIAGTESFKELIHQGKPYVISRPVLDKESGKAVFNILVMLKNSNGEKTGVLGGSILLETASKITSDIKVGESGYGWIIDDVGTMIAHPVAEERLNLNLLRTDKIQINKRYHW